MMNSFITRIGKIFSISILFIVLIYLSTFFTAYHFISSVRNFAFATTILAAIMSGALLSGDRLRGNFYSSKESMKSSFMYSENLLIFSIPFYLIMFIHFLLTS